MAKTVEIPQDIIDSIIAAVGDDTRLLKQCSLVSSSFLLPSRKQLFSIITLSSDQTCQRIHQFLVQNPVIQSSVRAITLTGKEFEYVPSWGTRNPDWMNGTLLPAILRLPFRCIERFSINVPLDYWNPVSWNWNDFSSELKDALSNIIHSSSLKTLSLGGITKLPTTFFLHIVHLTTLELHSVSPNDFRNENSSSLIRAASNGVAPMDSHLVIDRCMWRLNLKEESEHRSELARGPTSIFLPFMCRPRVFEINVDLGSATAYDFDILSFLMGSLCISLTSPATLEHLEFYISFNGKPEYLDYYTFYEDLRDADVWSHLDSIATHPSGSRLQRVDINIEYWFGRWHDNDEVEPEDNEVLKAVLDSLPLLRTKGILFVEAALGV